MSDSIEERVRRLERFRYRMLGMVNAQNALLTDLVCDLLSRESDPFAALETQKRDWLARSEMRAAGLLRIDPAEGDLISQEYRDAVNLLAKTIDSRLRLRRPPGR